MTIFTGRRVYQRKLITTPIVGRNRDSGSSPVVENITLLYEQDTVVKPEKGESEVIYEQGHLPTMIAWEMAADLRQLCEAYLLLGDVIRERYFQWLGDHLFLKRTEQSQASILARWQKVTGVEGVPISIPTNKPSGGAS